MKRKNCGQLHKTLMFTILALMLKMIVLFQWVSSFGTVVKASSKPCGLQSLLYNIKSIIIMTGGYYSDQVSFFIIMMI